MVFQKSESANPVGRPPKEKEAEPEQEQQANNISEYGFIILDKEIDMLMKEIVAFGQRMEQMELFLNQVAQMQKVLADKIESPQQRFNSVPIQQYPDVPSTLPPIEEKKRGISAFFR